ncbi:MAG: hypothetical protein ACFCGT_26265 [Sandaracinaceae bacterium]
MPSPARAGAVEALRSLLRKARVEPASPRAPGVALTCGWTAVDRALGGLHAGETALVEGEPGSGTLALASSWARAAARAGEPTVVFDTTGSSHPHAWVEPPDGRAPIWRFTAGERDVWPAVDIAARARAFGLLVLLEPPPAPVGAAARMRRLALEGGLRVVMTQWPGRAAPWTPTHRVLLVAGTVRWTVGPVGDAPAERTLEVHYGRRRDPAVPVGAERRADAIPPRLPAPAPPPDRRAPSGRSGRRRRSGR